MTKMPRVKVRESADDRFCRIYHERLVGRMSYRGLTIEDIAEILGCTVQTARKKIHHIPLLTIAEIQALNAKLDFGLAVVDRMEGEIK